MATAEEIYGRDIAFKSDFVPTASGDLDTVEGLANVKEAILRRILTTPGGIVHRPDYGVGLKDFQGAINSISAQRELAARLQEQLPQDPRIERVLSLSVNSEDDRPELVKIVIRVQLVGYGEQTLTFVPFGDT